METAVALDFYVVHKIIERIFILFSRNIVVININNAMNFGTVNY